MKNMQNAAIHKPPAELKNDDRPAKIETIRKRKGCFFLITPEATQDNLRRFRIKRGWGRL